jgi:hypothetical protein
MTYLFDVTCFGAIGDGITDDTAAIQAAIDAATGTGAAVILPPASGYKQTAPWNITGPVGILGMGYANDTLNLFQPNGYKASQIIPYGDITSFNIATDYPVYLEKFGISYNQSCPPAAGTPAIKLDTGNQGSVHANKESVFRDIFIIGGGVGVQVNNALGFLFDHIHVEGAKNYSMILRDINYPGSGDSVVTNCTMSSSGVAAHMLVQSGGGLRIVNNKCNSCRVGGQLIFINPNLPTAQGISPLIINNNSLEHSSNNSIGILFQRNVGTEVVGNVVIVGNELANSGTNTQGIVMQANGATPWILGGVIASNFIYATSFGVTIDGASSINVIGNTMMGAGTAYGSTGVSTNIQFIGNLKGPGVA